MQNHTHPLCRAIRRLAPLALPVVLLLLMPRAQAQSGGPLLAWKNDVTQPHIIPSTDPAGDGTVSGTDLVARVVSGTPSGTFKAVAAGDSFCVALRADGTLVSWGSNDNGQVTGTPAGVFQSISAAGSYCVGLQGYAWSGFLPPLYADGSSVFKLGSTVPVKLQLTGLSAGITNLTATLSYARVSNNTPGPVCQAVSTSAATTGNLFRYDPTSGQYIFNWSTKGLTVGTYQLQVNLGAGIIRTVNINLR